MSETDFIPTDDGTGDVWLTYDGEAGRIREGTIVKMPDGRRLANLGGYLQDLDEEFTLPDGTTEARAK